MVQTSVLMFASVGIHPTSSGTVGSLCFNESKARDCEKLTNLVLTSNAFPGRPSRESVQGLMNTCLGVCAADLTKVCSPGLFNDGSMQLVLSTGVAADLGTGWNLHTKPRRDKCSSELRTAKPKILTANPPCPLCLKLQNSNQHREINPAGVYREHSHHNTISSPICCARILEQMHRGDHFIFERPSNASSWNELRVQKIFAPPGVFRVEDQCVAGMC